MEINGAYANGLSAGSATIQLVTTEMIYEKVIAINNTPNTGEEVKPTTPPTGDTSQTQLFLALLCLGFIGFGCTRRVCK